MLRRQRLEPDAVAFEGHGLRIDHGAAPVISSKYNNGTPRYDLPPTLRVAALAVELAGAGRGIVGVEANGIGGKRSRDAQRFGEQRAADAGSLALGRDRHVDQVQRLRAGREVRDVDRPRLLGLQRQRADDLAALRARRARAMS